MLNLIIFGPPGVGKGTQAIKLAEHYNLVHISTGDILRNEIKRETELGIMVKDFLDRGDLVTDELLILILESVFDDHKDATGFIFDGFPRTLPQAEALDRMMARKSYPLTNVLSLVVPLEELLKRLLIRSEDQGRTDDTEEIIKNRLIKYQKHTEPLIDFFQKKGIFTEIHGVGTVDEIFKKLCNIIDLDN